MEALYVIYLYGDILTFLCPAGPDQQKLDYDISLNSAPLSHISGLR